MVEFTLDSLPSGTQTLEIRQLGFSPTEVAVELSQQTPQSVTVKMARVRAGPEHDARDGDPRARAERRRLRRSQARRGWATISTPIS